MSNTPQPESYLLDDRLEAAVNTAIELELPLLLTGEPGTGKTRLAYHIAASRNTECLRFNTKTTSKARDLLYQYNALLHFRDANTQQEDLNVLRYINFSPLGQAIIQAAHQQYVVLIDEIDKAPRDFPNDVLFEFEEMKFRIEEATLKDLKSWREQEGLSLSFDKEGFIQPSTEKYTKPILILTSNSEKNLPDAFLRRCAYYHIPFPDQDRLVKIVRSKSVLRPEVSDKLLRDLIKHFEEIRNLNLKKKPATAELLAWVRKLQTQDIFIERGLDLESPELRERLADAYILLAKTREDRETLLNRLFPS